MARSIQESDFPRRIRSGSRPRFLWRRDFNFVGRNMLGYATGFFVYHVCFSDVVQKRGFAMVNMAHDHHYRWARDCLPDLSVVRAGIFLFLVFIHWSIIKFLLFGVLLFLLPSIHILTFHP